MINPSPPPFAFAFLYFFVSIYQLYRADTIETTATTATMIVIKTKAELTCDEIAKCNKLIIDNFGNSRFDTYSRVIYYIIENKIIGFVGISDNYLNQLCTDSNYRNRGIASDIIESARDLLGGTIYLFINKDNKDAPTLLKFYTKRNFNIEYENEVEYIMYNVLLYKN